MRVTFIARIFAAVLIFLVTIFLDTNAVNLTVDTFANPSIVTDCLSAPNVTVNVPASFKASISRLSPTENADPDSAKIVRK